MVPEHLIGGNGVGPLRDESPQARYTCLACYRMTAADHFQDRDAVVAVATETAGEPPPDPLRCAVATVTCVACRSTVASDMFAWAHIWLWQSEANVGDNSLVGGQVLLAKAPQPHDHPPRAIKAEAPSPKKPDLPPAASKTPANPELAAPPAAKRKAEAHAEAGGLVGSTARQGLAVPASACQDEGCPRSSRCSVAVGGVELSTAYVSQGFPPPKICSLGWPGHATATRGAHGKSFDRLSISNTLLQATTRSGFARCVAGVAAHTCLSPRI